MTNQYHLVVFHAQPVLVLIVLLRMEEDLMIMCKFSFVFYPYSNRIKYKNNWIYLSEILTNFALSSLSLEN